MKKAVTLVLLMIGSYVSMAATYYIDYVAGNDSNNGTSTSTPWKRHPYMATEAVSYSHTAGDVFIFKGGVTWPRAVLPLVLLAGGSSSSVHDYYGVSNSWFTGASWSRPVFDFENNQIAGYFFGAGVQVTDVNYITFDNLEMKRHRGTLGPSSANYGCSTIAIVNTASSINILNCLIYDWDLPSSPTSGQDGAGGGGIVYAGSGTSGGFMISNNVFHCNGSAFQSGLPLSLGGRICFNTVSNTGSCYVGGGNIHNNYFHHTITPADPVGNHSNGILVQSGASTIYSNRLHNLCAQSTGIYCDTGSVSGTGTGTNLVYANYLGSQAQISLQLDTHNGTNVGMRAFNNTIVGVGGVGACVRVTASGGGSMWVGHMELRNNWFLTSGSVLQVDTGIINTIANYNLTNTTASANSYGAIAGNYYWPTIASSPTIDAGTNLLAYFTRSLPFDVGADEYAPPATPAMAIGPGTTLGSGINLR